MADKYWDRVPFDKIRVSNLNKWAIDNRWVLRDNEDPTKAHGSLRIVSHSDLKSGYCRAYMEIVVKRIPRTPEEIAAFTEEFLMTKKDMVLWSVYEHLETTVREYTEPIWQLEKIFNVEVLLNHKQMKK